MSDGSDDGSQATHSLSPSPSGIPTNSRSMPNGTAGGRELNCRSGANENPQISNALATRYATSSVSHHFFFTFPTSSYGKVSAQASQKCTELLTNIHCNQIVQFRRWDRMFTNVMHLCNKRVCHMCTANTEWILFTPLFK